MGNGIIGARRRRAKSAHGFSYPLEGDDKAQFIAECVSGNLTVKHINRDQISVRVFGPTAILTARDSTTWTYHGRELSGQYKILNIYSKRDGEWKLCALQPAPNQSLN